jgi:hypothetical protein
VGEVVVQPWLLRLSLWIMLATFVVLTATIIAARVTCSRRERALVRRVGPLREDVLTLVSGEDEGGSATRLSELRGQSVALVTPMLVGYLSKIRGTPAQRVVDVLVAHGLVRRARAGVTSWSGTRRARSVWALGVMRIRDAAADVVPRLQDRDRGVAVTSARSLGMLGDAAAAEALLAAVAPGRRGRGELPVWVVVEALVGLGPQAADTVGRALEGEDASTRAVAAMTIGRAQHLSQTTRLRELAGREEDPTVLAALAEAIGELGQPADTVVLTTLTERDQPRSVRLAAVRALGELADPGAISALGALLGDTDPRIGELAADVLVALGPAGLAEVEGHTGGDAAAAADYGLAMHALRHPVGGRG